MSSTAKSTVNAKIRIPVSRVSITRVSARLERSFARYSPRMTAHASTMSQSEAYTESVSPGSRSDFMKNVTRLALEFNRDEDVFARLPVRAFTSLRSLSIFGGTVRVHEGAHGPPERLLSLSNLDLSHVKTHDASDEKLGNVLFAVLEQLPVVSIKRLSIGGAYGDRYEDPTGEVVKPDPQSYGSLEVRDIVFDRCASTYDHFLYLSQVLVPGSLITLRVELSNWKDLEALRDLLIAAGHLVVSLDISLANLIEHEECNSQSPSIIFPHKHRGAYFCLRTEQSGPMPPWNFLVDCVAACPRLKQHRLRVLPRKNDTLDAAKDFDPSRYVPFGTVLRVLPPTIKHLAVRFTARWDTCFGGEDGTAWDLHALDDAIPSSRFPLLQRVSIEYELGDFDIPDTVRHVVAKALPRLASSNLMSYTVGGRMDSADKRIDDVSLQTPSLALRAERTRQEYYQPCTEEGVRC